MDEFLRLADQLVIYKLRKSWLTISKLYNEMAAEHDGTMSMAFILIAIDEENGIPVTKIAPRLGMEPNSLSRIIKSLEKKGLISRDRTSNDRRKSYVRLTKLGLEKREIAIKAVYRLERAIISDMSPDVLEGFFETTAHIPEAVERFRKRTSEKEQSVVKD
jgi:MarR family transcriptional regulator, organic hydroperoxide resistance regulator